MMKKRLKSHYKRQKLLQTAAEDGATDTYYDYICVVDFEATCEEHNPSDFHHEIIEFPMVLINTHTLEIVSGLYTVSYNFFLKRRRKKTSMSISIFVSVMCRWTPFRSTSSRS